MTIDEINAEQERLLNVWLEKKLRNRPRTCNRCDQTKPATEFEPYAESLDGLRLQCRDCRNWAQARDARERRRQARLDREYLHRDEVMRPVSAAVTTRRDEHTAVPVEAHP